MGTQNRQPTLNEDGSEHEFSEIIQREMIQKDLLDLKNLNYLKSKLPKISKENKSELESEKKNSTCKNGFSPWITKLLLQQT